MEPEDLAGGLDLAERASAGRPYCVLNMVSSVDGKATVKGRSGGISSETDRQVFHLLRTQADAVLVGTTTVRKEGYGKLTKSAGLQEHRARGGLRPVQLAVLFSRSLDLPLDAGLFQDPASEVVVFTSSDGEPGQCPAKLTVVRQDGDGVDPAAALEDLRRDHGVRSLLCEGGPGLNASLLEAGCVDELFLTLAPLLVGGADALTIIAGPGRSEPDRLELVHAALDEAFLFLRYRVAAPNG